MNQFCEDVIEFLQSEYNDGYNFNLEVSRSLHSEDMIELKIKVNSSYIIIVNNYCMKYIFSVYKSGKYNQERNLWQWQKELVDLIEGS